MNRNYQAIVSAAVTLLLAACSTGSVPYPPPMNPFLAGAPPLENVKLGQPTRAVLVWLEPAGMTASPDPAQRALANKIKREFTAGKSLEVVGTVSVPAPTNDPLTQIRKAAAPFQVQEALVVMPNVAAISSPVWLKYGQDGNGVGTRTDSYASVSLVAIDLSSGTKLFSLVNNGQARLWKMDYEDARPFFPRISPGAYSSAFIYPSGSDFPPGEVHAVAMEQAVNALIYNLDHAIGS